MYRRRGTAFVIYEDIFDAKNACEHLSGFNVGGRYLSVLYYQVNRTPKGSVAQQEAEVAALRARVAAGEAASGADDSLDDSADKKLMKR
jgi:pre-mRNA branch site protein p14